MTDRIFLLSPAHCGGKRAAMLLNRRAQFVLARRLRETDGASLGEAFSFLSGLYFRGKLAYARAFARPPTGVAGAIAITTNRGLLPVDTPITLDELRALGEGDISLDDLRYRTAMETTAQALLSQLGSHCDIVLLGSIATGKYVDPLLDVFGPRLHFPSEFIGRGDMSRGGLMLRCVQESCELTYAPLAGAVRHGARPPKLQRTTPSITPLP